MKGRGQVVTAEQFLQKQQVKNFEILFVIVLGICPSLWLPYFRQHCQKGNTPLCYGVESKTWFQLQPGVLTNLGLLLYYFPRAVVLKCHILGGLTWRLEVQDQGISRVQVCKKESVPCSPPGFWWSAGSLWYSLSGRGCPDLCRHLHMMSSLCAYVCHWVLIPPPFLGPPYWIRPHLNLIASVKTIAK